MADVQHAQAGLPAVLLQRQREGARAAAGCRRAEADAAAMGGREGRQPEILPDAPGVHADLLLWRQRGQARQGLHLRACFLWAGEWTYIGAQSLSYELWKPSSVFQGGSWAAPKPPQNESDSAPVCCSNCFVSAIPECLLAADYV